MSSWPIRASRGAGEARAQASSDEHTYAHRARGLPRARRARGRGHGVSRGPLVAVVPAWNEEGAIGQVVDEIKAFDPTRPSSSSTTHRAMRQRAWPRRTERPCSGSSSTSASAARCRPGSVRAGRGVRSRCGSTAMASTTRPSSGSFTRSTRGRGSRHRLAVRRSRWNLPPTVRQAHGHPRVRAARVAPRRQKVTDTTSGFVALTAPESSSSRSSTRTTTRRSKRRSSRYAAGCGSRRCRSRCASARRALVDHVRPALYYIVKVTLALSIAKPPPLPAPRGARR